MALSAGSALGQPCFTCRTERCPTKEGLTEWCGKGPPPAVTVKCPEGRVRAPGSRSHCCWPGQTWDRESGACAGLPAACPAGLRAVGQSCAEVPAAPPAPLPVEPPRPPCPLEMVVIPGGAFRAAAGDAVVAGFCLDASEATAKDYGACVSEGACAPGHAGPGCNAGVPDRALHPINCVDWYQAETFCRSRGKRLPTGHEWEWAARGGVSGRTYPWGDAEPTDRACWNGSGGPFGTPRHEGTCEVASNRSGDGPPGVHDLAGNVAEWTREHRVRGGSFGSVRVAFVRADAEAVVDEKDQGQLRFVGFRCAKDLP